MDASLLVSQIRLVMANFSCSNFFVIIFFSYHIRRWESAMTHIFVWLLLHSFGLQMDLTWEWPQLPKLIISAASTFINVRLFSINILSFLLIFDLDHILYLFAFPSSLQQSWYWCFISNLNSWCLLIHNSHFYLRLQDCELRNLSWTISY